LAIETDEIQQPFDLTVSSDNIHSPAAIASARRRDRNDPYRSTVDERHAREIEHDMTKPSVINVAQRRFEQPHRTEVQFAEAYDQGPIITEIQLNPTLFRRSSRRCRRQRGCRRSRP
jgi:hypothetical protein